MRKHQTDDFADWRLRQENISKPFPYVFPQMPPRFRRCCAFAKAVFLIQWGGFAVFALGSIILFVPVVVWDVELDALTDGRPLLSLLVLAAAVSLLLYFLAFPFRFAPKLYWRCPCCGCRFPYHVLKRGDPLREKECLLNIKRQHIKYAKLKFCPLIIPSICPECKCKFFDMADGFSP